MLVFDLPDNNPTSREGITCFKCDSSIAVQDQPTASSFRFCAYECEENLLAFADSSASATRRTKDYFTLYFQSNDESATLQFSIIGETEIVLVDGLHGESITNGFIVDFTKIFTEIGGGAYTLRMVVNEFGEDKTVSYGKFQVCPYNDIRADQTVKIESTQNGSIDSGFNFGQDSVPFSIRIPGIFGDRQEITENSSTPDALYDDQQVHDRMWYEYELKFDSNKYRFVNLIFENMLLGTDVYVSDYNLTNETTEEPYDMVKVRKLEVERNRVSMTNTTEFVVKFEDSKKNIIKRPYIESC